MTTLSKIFASVKTEIILGTSSPYRQKIFAELGIPFKAHPSPLDEESLKKKNLTPYEVAYLGAKGKAYALQPLFSQACIITGDQTGELQGKRLDKPLDYRRAFEMLSELSGREHFLHTAMTILTPQDEITWVETVTLRMKKLTPEAIRQYIKRDRPFDCAGSYKYEENGYTLFEFVSTQDITVIQGLPLKSVEEKLLRLVNSGQL